MEKEDQCGRQNICLWKWGAVTLKFENKTIERDPYALEYAICTKTCPCMQRVTSCVWNPLTGLQWILAFLGITQQLHSKGIISFSLFHPASHPPTAGPSLLLSPHHFFCAQVLRGWATGIASHSAKPSEPSQSLRFMVISSYSILTSIYQGIRVPREWVFSLGTGSRQHRHVACCWWKPRSTQLDLRARP